MNDRSSIVEEIKSRANITDVVSRYVELKRAGSLLKACCPFHSEKTPSFTVNEDRGTYKCFGCGEYGDVISFVSKIENLSFSETVEKLCEDYNIDASQYSFNAQKVNNSFYDITKATAVYYYNMLISGVNPGYAYIHERGLSDATITAFSIGYADETGYGLLNELTSKGFNLKDAVKVDALKEWDGKIRDGFFNRVIFPIINTRDKVIGFGGRDITGKARAKYLNSKESEIFHKRNNLYAINLTRSEITKAGYAIVVEGYMDVVSLYDKGVKNVTATLGTALTPEQAAMIKRYTSDVVLCYDSDNSGINSAIKGIDILRDAGLNVKVLNVSNGKDPDEFIKANGKEAFLKEVSEALPGIEYKLTQLRRHYDFSQREGSIGYVKAAVGILRGISAVEADYYIRLLSKQAGLSEGAIRLELSGGTGMDLGIGGSVGYENEAHEPSSQEQNVQTRPARDRAAEASEHAGINAYTSLERHLIRLLIYDPKHFSQMDAFAHIFVDHSYYMIVDMIIAIVKEEPNGELDLGKLRDSLDTQELLLLEDILENVALSDEPEVQFQECKRTVENLSLKKRQEEILLWLTEVRDDESKAQLLGELVEVQQRIREQQSLS
ncbi:MAG: DNA primase [Clostridiales Family XIII bacterium]|jgi:DNA primase|nr:DNA primase [Clostridiales Family XIII bacterium]